MDDLVWCVACDTEFLREKFSKSQLKKRYDLRRCRKCVSGDVQQKVTASIQATCRPVSKFIQVLFSEEEKDRFDVWILQNGKSKDVIRVVENPSLTYVFDRLLSEYKEPFQGLCGKVDPVTNLYPLQKAARMGLRWDRGVRYVYEAGDDVIGFPDPESGLLPF